MPIQSFFLHIPSFRNRQSLPLPSWGKLTVPTSFLKYNGQNWHSTLTLQYRTEQKFQLCMSSRLYHCLFKGTHTFSFWTMLHCYLSFYNSWLVLDQGGEWGGRNNLNSCSPSFIFMLFWPNYKAFHLFFQITSIPSGHLSNIQDSSELPSQLRVPAFIPKHLIFRFHNHMLFHYPVHEQEQ